MYDASMKCELICVSENEEFEFSIFRRSLSSNIINFNSFERVSNFHLNTNFSWLLRYINCLGIWSDILVAPHCHHISGCSHSWQHHLHRGPQDHGILQLPQQLETHCHWCDISRLWTVCVSDLHTSTKGIAHYSIGER